MKKYLAIILAILIFTLSLPLTAFAQGTVGTNVVSESTSSDSSTSCYATEPFSVSENFDDYIEPLSLETTSSSFTYIEQDGYIYITGRTEWWGTETLEIPAVIDGKTVKGILDIGYANIKNLIIPDSVTVLGESAFSSLYNLETVTIGAGIENLNDDLFSNCYLKEIKVSANNQYYADIDGVLYNKSKTTLISYPLGKEDSSYTVPASVTDIDVLTGYKYNFLQISFEDTSKLFVTEEGVTYNADKTKIIFCNTEKSGYYKMPDSVVSIDEGAFEGCEKLTGVKMSSKVTEIVYLPLEVVRRLPKFHCPKI